MPGTADATRVMNGVSDGSLSALSARRTISRSYVQPYISAAARQTRSAAVSMYALISVVMPRVSQHISASAGTTLRAEPPRIVPTFTRLAPSPWRGMASILSVAHAAAATALRPSCGDAPECALCPTKRTLNFDEARMPVHPAATTPDSSRLSPTCPP